MSDAGSAQGAGQTTGTANGNITNDPPDQGNPDELGDAGKKALDSMKAKLKEANAKAKSADALQAELDTLKARTMSETEKAIDQARKEASAETRVVTLREFGSKLVDAEVKAASAGRNIDVDALLDGLDRNRFMNDEGDVDAAAVTAWIDKLAPKADAGSSFPDLGQGARNDQMALNGDPLLKDLKAKLGIR